MYVKCIKSFIVSRCDSHAFAGQYETEIIEQDSFWIGDFDEKDNRFHLRDGNKLLRITKEMLDEYFDV